MLFLCDAKNGSANKRTHRRHQITYPTTNEEMRQQPDFALVHIFHKRHLRLQGNIPIYSLANCQVFERRVRGCNVRKPTSRRTGRTVSTSTSRRTGQPTRPVVLKPVLRKNPIALRQPSVLQIYLKRKVCKPVPHFYVVLRCQKWNR